MSSPSRSPHRPHHHTRSEPLHAPSLGAPSAPAGAGGQGQGHLHPDALPAHLRPPSRPGSRQGRPTNSRHHSANSVHSYMSSASRRPRPQQPEFVPTTTAISAIAGGEGLGDTGLTERWMFESDDPIDPESPSIHGDEDEERLPGQARFHDEVEEHLAPKYGSEHHEEYEEDDEEEEEPEPAWDNMRDGSIARRPAWRRPSPRWVYPLITGSTIAAGAGMAPRSELLINLACLAHPPSAPYDTSAPIAGVESWAVPNQMSHMMARGMGQGFGGPPIHDQGSWWTEIVSPTSPPTPQDGDLSINTTMPSPDDPNLSPADRWFLKVQHEIYEWNLHHGAHAPGAPSSSSSRSRTEGTITATETVASPSPSGPIPHPTGAPPQAPLPGEGNGGNQTDDGNGGGPYHQIDPRLCKKDPTVQAATAKLTMAITMTSGILAALTIGQWASMSDRKGRTRVMAICQTGLLLNELCFVLIATYPYLAPGGYRALIIGPAIDGILGGGATIGATVSAYMSDVTPDGSRATVFARLGGISMIGFAMGPIIGAMVIKYTGNILFPFYVNIVVHIVYILVFIFILPESLSSEARVILQKNAVLAKERWKRKEAAEREWENVPAGTDYGATRPLIHQSDSAWSRLSGVNSSRRRKRAVGTLRRVYRGLRHPFMPLAIFKPTIREDGSRNWNLFFAGGASFFCAMMMGVFQVKTQFTFYSYGWTAADLGPYMSLVSATRAVVLVAVIPVVMHFIKPYFTPPLLVDDAAGAPGASGFSTRTIESSPGGETPAPPRKIKRSAALDLWAVRICMGIEMFGYLVLALNVSPVLFVIISCWNTLGSGASPALSSICLSFLPSAQETGRLFGGIAVLHAIGATLISPVLFNMLFAYTVGWYAPTVFALAATTLFLAEILFAFVRIPAEKTSGKAERGRSRQVKRVKSSGIAGRVREAAMG